MGLDMYLYATRRLDKEAAAKVVDVAGVSVDELRAMSEQDPMREDTDLYLSGWEFSPESERTRCFDVLTAAGVLSMLAELSPSAHLTWADEAVQVSVICAYWRKANSIHSWFVQNCQGGRDECRESDPVDVEQLAYLAATCGKALASYRAGDIAGAEALMTPQAGFFFGSTEIDDSWARGMDDTVRQIEAAVRAAIEVGGITFTYQSSW